MALTKPIEADNTGIICKYRRIDDVNTHYWKNGEKETVVAVQWYTGKDVRDDDKNPLATLYIDIFTDDYNTYFEETGVTRVNAYKFLKENQKENNKFFGAQDA